jgi:pyrroline-5-carboxylate reductase
MPTSDTAPATTGLTAFIGGGNMARSLIAGLRRQGRPGSIIAVVEPVEAQRAALTAEFGVQAFADAAEVARSADLLVLAVKPQLMEPVCRALARNLKTDALLISIAAGIPCAHLSEWLGTPCVVRSMPNTPALLGAGATGLYAPPTVSAEQRLAAEAVLRSAGVTVWIEDENLMDVVTALSGSGPAYFFLLVEALVSAAVTQGLPREAAETLARHTALGAARMLVESGEEAAELRRRVTSPGGTTHAAVSRFQADGFEAGVAAAVDAAVRRGRALAGA